MNNTAARNEKNTEQKLLNYILSLTPEQANKIVNHLPELYALISESNQPCHQEQS